MVIWRPEPQERTKLFKTDQNLARTMGMDVLPLQFPVLKILKVFDENFH